MNEISFIRGTTLNLTLAINDSDGNVYTLGADEKVNFGVKRSTLDEDYSVFIQLAKDDQASDGSFSIRIGPDTTEKLDVGAYVYDVAVQTSDDYYNVIPPSLFEVLGNVTQMEA